MNPFRNIMNTIDCTQNTINHIITKLELSNMLLKVNEIEIYLRANINDDTDMLENDPTCQPPLKRRRIQ